MVVDAEFQIPHIITPGRYGGQHEDRDETVLLAHAPAQFQAIDARQLEIENDQASCAMT